jgi:hypothetical protein
VLRNLLLLFSMSICSPPQDLDRIVALENEILNQRKNLRDGRFEIMSTYWILRSDKGLKSDKGNATQKRKISLRVNGDSYRQDTLFLNDGSLRISSFFDNSHISRFQNANLKVNQTQVYPRDHQTSKAQDRWRVRLDLLGLVPFGTLNLVHHTTPFGRNDWEKAWIDEVEQKSEKYRVLNYRQSNGWAGTIWIAGQIDPRVVRVQYEWAEKKQRMTASVESEYDSTASGPHRFPVKCTFQRKRDDIPVETEVAEILLFDSQSVVDTKEFRLEGLDLPIGSRVDFVQKMGTPAPATLKKWDGSKVVEAKPINGVPLEPKTNHYSPLHYLILALILIAFTVWRVRKARNRTSG